MKRRSPREGGGSRVHLAGDTEASTDNPASAQLVRLPRRLFRKIVVEPVPCGWRARFVGFDPRFYSEAMSLEYPTRREALETALNASRATGLPVITVETLAPDPGPGQAA